MKQILSTVFTAIKSKANFPKVETVFVIWKTQFSLIPFHI